MSWTPVGFGRRNGNEPTGSQFIVHGGIELELFDANTLACSGAYLVSIQIGSLLVISSHLQLAVHWCGGTGKERPQIFTKGQVVFSVANCPQGLFYY